MGFFCPPAPPDPPVSNLEMKAPRQGTSKRGELGWEDEALLMGNSGTHVNCSFLIQASQGVTSDFYNNFSGSGIEKKWLSNMTSSFTSAFGTSPWRRFIYKSRNSVNGLKKFCFPRLRNKVKSQDVRKPDGNSLSEAGKLREFLPKMLNLQSIAYPSGEKVHKALGSLPF